MNTFKNISMKAVLIGLVADVGGTAAFFFVFALLGGFLLSSMGRGIEELDVYTKTTGFLVLSSIGGSLFSVFGGYISARIARKAEIRNASATGSLSALTGVVFLILSPGSSPLWLDVLALVTIVPCAMLGGYLCLKSKGEKGAKPER